MTEIYPINFKKDKILISHMWVSYRVYWNPWWYVTINISLRIYVHSFAKILHFLQKFMLHCDLICVWFYHDIKISQNRRQEGRKREGKKSWNRIQGRESQIKKRFPMTFTTAFTSFISNNFLKRWMEMRINVSMRSSIPPQISQIKCLHYGDRIPHC